MRWEFLLVFYVVFVLGLAVWLWYAERQFRAEVAKVDAAWDRLEAKVIALRDERDRLKAELAEARNPSSLPVRSVL